jgi:hypothetical protein
MEQNQQAQSVQTEPLTQQQPTAASKKKTIITALLLVLVPPLGIIFMWIWMKWPIWAKIVLTIMAIFLVLIVIFITPILLAITLVAVNPSRQEVQANNTQRASDVNAILNTVRQYAADNNGQLPAEITTTTQSISTTGADICKTLVPSYTAFFPIDPSLSKGEAIAVIDDCSVAYDTGYTIVQDASSHKITVSAPRAEGKEKIEITR